MAPRSTRILAVLLLLTLCASRAEAVDGMTTGMQQQPVLQNNIGIIGDEIHSEPASLEPHPLSLKDASAQKDATTKSLRGAPHTSAMQPQHTPQQHTQRHLQVDAQINNLRDMLRNLFNTPPAAWTAGQWFLAVLLFFLFLWCCGCCSGGRRYYSRGYYDQNGYYRGYRSTSGGCCGCLQNILLCFCCYELCCRDCQDVPCCDDYAAAGASGMV